MRTAGAAKRCTVLVGTRFALARQPKNGPCAGNWVARPILMPAEPANTELVQKAAEDRA
jgi:hypothetical protein